METVRVVFFSGLSTVSKTLPTWSHIQYNIESTIQSHSTVTTIPKGYQEVYISIRREYPIMHNQFMIETEKFPFSLITAFKYRSLPWHG